MSEKTSIMLRKVTQPGKVDKNNRVYTEEAFTKAIEEYIQKMGTSKIPVCINPPYSDGRAVEITKFCEVSLKDKIGTIDLSNPENHGEIAHVDIENTEVLRYLGNNCQLGLRYLTKDITHEGEVSTIDNMKIICYDILPKEE